MFEPRAHGVPPENVRSRENAQRLFAIAERVAPKSRSYLRGSDSSSVFVFRRMSVTQSLVLFGTAFHVQTVNWLLARNESCVHARTRT